MKKDIAIAGVGGQGNIFATNVLCQYAMVRGKRVLGTETIGAAQRGGSVVSHMRISDEAIYSPLIPAGTADVLVGMETLELLRHVGILDPDGYYIMNLYSAPTVFTNMGIDEYPGRDAIIKAVKKVCPERQGDTRDRQGRRAGQPADDQRGHAGRPGPGGRFLRCRRREGSGGAHKPAAFQREKPGRLRGGHEPCLIVSRPGRLAVGLTL